MTDLSWKPLREDREGATELLEVAAAEARRAGRDVEAEQIDAQRKDLQDAQTAGAILRGGDDRVWGLAIWTVLRGKGRRVSPVVLRKELQTSSGWRRFLTFLLESPDPDGPVLLFNTSLPGFPESEATRFLAPRGFDPFHRYGLAFPAGSPLPSAPPQPLTNGALRPLGNADVESLAALNVACYANTIDRFLFGEDSDPLAAARSLARSVFDGKYGTFVPDASFGLEVDGVLRGATLVTRRPTDKLLADVEVHPRFQGQGHARRLVRATLESLAADVTTPLVLAVTRENDAAFRLYHNLGFVVQEGPFTFWADTGALGLTPNTVGVGAAGHTPK